MRKRFGRHGGQISCPPFFEEIPDLHKITVIIGKQAKKRLIGSCTQATPSHHQLYFILAPSHSLCALRGGPYPKTDTRCMHAFPKTYNELRLKVRNATLRSIHHTSLYRPLVLKSKAQGGRTNTLGTAIHSYIRKSPKDGITLLKFIHGQL